MKTYTIEGTFSFSGCIDIAAESAQEAVDALRSYGHTSFPISDIVEADPEIENVYIRKSNDRYVLVKEEWN